MIKETALQSDVVAAVREAGGEATKLSNRFLVGVCDLLVKLPDRPAMLVEVKKDAYPVRFGKTISPDVTRIQFDFLDGYWQAGMVCGVLSFLIDTRKANRRYAAMFSLKEIRKLPLAATVSDYRELGRGDAFGPSVVELLRTLR